VFNFETVLHVNVEEESGTNSAECERKYKENLKNKTYSNSGDLHTLHIIYEYLQNKLSHQNAK